MKDISFAVQQQVKNYELTSRSKSYFRLKTSNVDKISKKIKESHHDKQLLELISKRDRLNKKIYELLDKAGEESDAKSITDIQEAESYLRRHFMHQLDKKEEINELMKKHKAFNRDMVQRQENIMKKYQAIGGYTKIGLSKLGLLQRREDIDREKEIQKELRRFYTEVSDKQRSLALESESILSRAGVPFFTLSSESASQLGLDNLKFLKAQVLDLLKKLLRHLRE